MEPIPTVIVLVRAQGFHGALTRCAQPVRERKMLRKTAWILDPLLSLKALSYLGERPPKAAKRRS